MKGHTGIRVTGNSQCGWRDCGDESNPYHKCMHMQIYRKLNYCNPCSLFRVSVPVAVSLPAVVVALQVYCPPWDVRRGENFSVRLWVKVELAVIIPLSLSVSTLIPTGVTHCTVKSSVSEPPSSRVTVQMKENSLPAVSVPVVEIATLGRGAVELIA